MCISAIWWMKVLHTERRFMEKRGQKSPTTVTLHFGRDVW